MRIFAFRSFWSSCFWSDGIHSAAEMSFHLFSTASFTIDKHLLLWIGLLTPAPLRCSLLTAVEHVQYASNGSFAHTHLPAQIIFLCQDPGPGMYSGRTMTHKYSTQANTHYHSYIYSKPYLLCHSSCNSQIQTDKWLWFTSTKHITTSLGRFYFCHSEVKGKQWVSYSCIIFCPGKCFSCCPWYVYDT